MKHYVTVRRRMQFVIHDGITAKGSRLIDAAWRLHIFDLNSDQPAPAFMPRVAPPLNKQKGTRTNVDSSM